jgi:malate synthase
MEIGEDPRIPRGSVRGGRYDEAAAIFAGLVERDDFVEFLTLPAYERID